MSLMENAHPFLKLDSNPRSAIVSSAQNVCPAPYVHELVFLPLIKFSLKSWRHEADLERQA